MDLAVELDTRLRALTALLRRRYAISITAASTLARLRDRGPQRVTDLAAAESVAQPSMTALVGRLERDGYVRREAHAHDRRSQLVAVTPAGERRLDEVRAARAAALQERLDALTAAEREALGAVLPILDHLITP
jgi:DNA-binding MarR family transcriptional regulator